MDAGIESCMADYLWIDGHQTGAIVLRLSGMNSGMNSGIAGQLECCYRRQVLGAHLKDHEPGVHDFSASRSLRYDPFGAGWNRCAQQSWPTATVPSWPRAPAANSSVRLMIEAVKGLIELASDLPKLF